ncbi:MAG: SPASM domain-containing protein [Candidatus Competibacter sp.]|nr:SPASM domain-containing protein [Candidatus Competibacter sp.]
MLKKLTQKFKDLFMLFYYRKYFEWGLPTRQFLQVNIETNTICNRTCHFCLYGIRNDVPANPMSASLFFRIMDQLAEMNFAGRLSLFSTNEPLTDKRIYEFIRYANLMLPDCLHTLVSNGDLLNRERLDRLFESGLDLLLLNSYDEEALQNNRDLYEYAHSRYSGKILHTDRTIYMGWVGRAGHITQYAKSPVKGYCDLPNYALYINPMGKVLSCCHDFDEQNLVGDLTQQTVEQVWHGVEFKTFRRRLNQGDRSYSELCNRCDHEPDLNYFRWNDLQPKLSGKGARWFPRKPDALKLAEAQAIKAKYLERESRPRPVRMTSMRKTALQTAENHLTS